MSFGYWRFRFKKCLELSRVSIAIGAISGQVAGHNTLSIMNGSDRAIPAILTLIYVFATFPRKLPR
jgi:hypothetical protein